MPKTLFRLFAVIYMKDRAHRLDTGVIALGAIYQAELWHFEKNSAIKIETNKFNKNSDL